MRVLLIEDNENYALLVREWLGRTGSDIEFQWADRLSSGLEILGAGGVDVVLLDLSLPDSFGVDTFDRVNAEAAEVPIVVLSSLEDEAVALLAVQRGAQDYLVKR